MVFGSLGISNGADIPWLTLVCFRSFISKTVWEPLYWDFLYSENNLMISWVIDSSWALLLQVELNFIRTEWDLSKGYHHPRSNHEVKYINWRTTYLLVLHQDSGEKLLHVLGTWNTWCNLIPDITPRRELLQRHQSGASKYRNFCTAAYIFSVNHYTCSQASDSLSFFFTQSITFVKYTDVNIY